jgi:hypothetical protein
VKLNEEAQEYVWVTLDEAAALPVEHYNATSRLVTGTQIYEIRDTEGQTVSREALDVRWFVHQEEAFAEFVHSLGFTTVALYGDYERARFEPERSPFMIWVLGAG